MIFAIFSKLDLELRYPPIMYILLVFLILGILYVTIGFLLNRVVKGSSYFSVLKGVLDSGLDVKHSEKILPTEDFFKGIVIENYAKKLMENKELYEKQF